MVKKQQQKSKEEKIREQISLYHKKISQLKMEISYLQDLISDLNSDLSLLQLKKGNPSGNTEKEEE